MKTAAAADWQWLAPAVEMAAVVTGHWPLARHPSPSGWTSLPRVATRTQGAGIGSVRAARDFTAATLRRWGIDAHDDVVVVVSELVTNALRHTAVMAADPKPRGSVPEPALSNGRAGACAAGGGQADGRAGLPASGHDRATPPGGWGASRGASPGTRRQPVRLGLLLQPGPCVLCAVFDPSDRAPVVREPGWCGESGRGLHVVASLSDEWGWTLPSPAGKVVWAMFSLPRRPIGSLAAASRAITR